MKLKFPKTVTIGDTTFNIKYDPKSSDGEFEFPSKGKPAFLRLGTVLLKENPHNFLQIVIHELLEIIAVEQSTRLWNRGNDSYIFLQNHSEFTDSISRLAGILPKFIE